MARRFGAMLAMVMIVVLVMFLVWRVYLHHRASGGDEEEPGVIAALPHAVDSGVNYSTSEISVI